MDPTEDMAAAIAQAFGGGPARRIDRFLTGAQHFVFDVDLHDGRAVVLRLSRPAEQRLAESALRWSRLLRPIGVPLPKVLAHDTTMNRHPVPYLILERLPGRDLGDQLQGMTRAERDAVAAQLVAVQRRVMALPSGAGYGFTVDSSVGFPHQTWPDVLRAELSRSDRRIRSADSVNAAIVGIAKTALERHAPTLADQPAIPFLHDITTKNVVVDQGRLSGIVDVDDLCYGDPLYLPALLRMALMAHDLPMDYLEAWLCGLNCDQTDVKRLDLYTLIHCAGFLSELGTRFNRDAPQPVDPAYRDRLLGIFDDLAGRV